MCTSPLKIFNPKKEPTYRDKMWLLVPCGKCQECRRRNQNDWFVRSFFEYLDCKSKRGTTLYVTLTYKNDFLPTFDNTPVFSRDDIQKFLKRLRKRVKSYLGSDCIRYFITSEYGGETHRSHYHGFIYIYHPDLSFYQISELKHIITSAWSYHGGFVSFGRKGSYAVRGVVENSAAFSYVSKYVGKDISFPYENINIPKDVQPFHLQSQHLGEYMIKHYGLDDNSTFSFRMMVDGTFCLGSINSQFTYAIPQYITKKVLYDYKYERHEELIAIGSAPYFIKEKSSKIEYFLNDFGLRVKKEKELHSLEFLHTEFNNIFDNLKRVLYQLSPEDLNYLLGRSRYTLKHGTPSDLLDFLDSTWYSWTNKEQLQMVIYTSLFKDRVVIPNALYSLSDTSTSLNDALLYLDDIYKLDVPSILHDEISDALEHSLDFFKETVTRRLYSSNLRSDRYHIYDDLISLFNAFNAILGKHKELELINQQKRDANAKLCLADVV